MINPPPPHLKWISNHRYALYIIRELTAIPLAVYGISLVSLMYLAGTAELELLESLKSVFLIISYIALPTAIIHSMTWFFALPKIFPFSLREKQEKISAISIIAIWIALSYLVYIYFAR